MSLLRRGEATTQRNVSVGGLAFCKLHPSFVAEVSAVDLRTTTDADTLEQIRAGMDEHAVLVFRDQFWSDAEHLSFAQRLDGALDTLLGVEFSNAEQDALRGAVQPLVRTIPRSGRRSLYLASHASRIVEWPVPEGRLLLRDLIEHATQPQFVYRHRWRTGDLVIWDNRATMHRARPFDDATYRRELRRVTTLDIEK